MKKLISILLVAMLIIGMFPATVFAADTTETLTIYANKGTVSGTSISWTQNGVTFTNNKGSSSTAIRTSDSDHYRVYANSNIAITAPGNITKIVITTTGTSYATAMKDSAGTGATVSGSVVTIVPTATSDTYTIAKMTAQSRINKVAVTYAASEPGTPACEHPETVAIGEAKAANCTETGMTAGEKCANPDCATVLEAQKVIPALGHNYVDGTCATCGVSQPAGYVLVTDVSSLKANDKVIITATKGTKTYAMSNDNGTSKAPAGVQVTVDNGVIAEAAANLVWNVSYSNGSLTFYPDGVTNKWLYCTSTNNGVRVGDNANKTFTIDATSGYLKHTGTSRYLGVYETTPDWRCYTTSTTTNIANQTLAFYAQSTGGTCDHSLTVTIPEVPATCTVAGTEEIQKCACGETVVGGAEIPALNHSYTDDACIRCNLINPDAANKAELMTALPNDGDVIIIYHVKEKVLMASTASENRMEIAAATASGTQMPYSATAVSLLTVEIDEDGNYLFLSADGKYMTSGATGNTLTFAEEATQYSLWDIELLENNKVYIHNVNAQYNNVKQSLEVYQNKFYPYTFKSDYASSYEMQLYLVEAGVQETPVVEMDGVQYGSFEEAYQQDPDTPIKLLAPLENVNVTGDLYLDLNGYTADVDNANAVYAYDSTAKATTAGTGKLTTTAPVIIDNTVNGVRYIALEEQATRSTESTYTFHVLELNLTYVTLRASEEGLYYKAAIKCDEVLADAIEYHGLVVSIENMPGADFASVEERKDNNGWTKVAGAPEGGELTSCSVFGIFKPGRSDNAARGAQKIYANAYIQLKGEEQTILVADTKNAGKQAGIGYSLQDVMEALNTTFPTLNLNDPKQAQQRETILDFYKAWPTAMQGWNIGNIKEAA